MDAEPTGGAHAYRRMQRRADEVCSMILSDEWAAIDVVIEIRKLREFAERHFPDRVRLFERVYESRFRRLWEQFRQARDGPLPEW